MKAERASKQLFWCLFVVYTINILGKMSFSAATVALINDSVLTKTQAGIISGAFWLLYAIGQFAGGFIANKMNPYTLINFTVISSMLANFIMGFSENFLIMLLTWGISGLLQFGLWPSILRLISTEIIPSQRMKSTEGIAFCYCLGSGISYVLAAVIFAMFSWEYLFVSCGIVIGLSYFVMAYAKKRLSPILKAEEEPVKVTVAARGKLTWGIVCEGGLISFCVLVTLKSIVDSGIKSWMPTIMLETYGASPSFTSVLSVILLVTNLFGVILAAFVYHKTKYDELMSLRVLYAMIIPMMLLLLNFKNMNILIVTILMSAITVLIYGSGQILLMNYPGRFHLWGLTATVGGIVNAFASFGNVIASYGSGFVADNFGWSAMIVIWNALVLLFVVLTIIMIPMWKKFRRKE